MKNSPDNRVTYSKIKCASKIILKIVAINSDNLTIKRGRGTTLIAFLYEVTMMALRTLMKATAMSSSKLFTYISHVVIYR